MILGISLCDEDVEISILHRLSEQVCMVGYNGREKRRFYYLLVQLIRTVTAHEDQDPLLEQTGASV
jgi:hypothetical protein